ncbi:odorant receptor 9a-like isoform X1 [Megalopta genalis]|uniref:odorant receptor 9a-like isoform X1 n=1 Tax=Megalopta genalis TaxID=115081 RepID=UPI003FD0E1AB
MTRHANKDFSYAMGAVRILSSAVGTWPLQKYNFVSGIRCFIAVLLLLAMLTVVNTEMYLDINDAEKNMDALMLISCYILAVYKVMWFRIRSKGLVVNFLSALKDYDELASQEKKVIVRRHAQMGRAACGTFMLSSYLGCTLISMLPMLVREDKSAVENLNVTHEVSLNYPVPSDCTMDLLNLPVSLYPVIYIAEYMLLLVASVGNFGSDSLFYGIIFHLCGQAEVLKVELSQCFEVGEKKARFYTLIARHQQLLKLSKYLNDTISSIMIVQLFLSYVLICTSGNDQRVELRWSRIRSDLVSLLSGFQFIRSLNTNNFVMMVKATIVVSTLLAQLFAYSYVGEYLKTQFEGVGYCIYCSSWYNIPRKISMDVVFFLMRSQKPVHLKAGNFFFVNLETYMSIVKTSMSYLSVLRVMVA